MFTLENHSRVMDAAAPRGGRRWRWAALAALVGLQLLGYLLVWIVLHATTGPKKAPACSEVLVSTGWYERGSAYAAWFARLPFVGSIPNAPAARHFLLAAGFALASAGYLAALLLVRRSSLPIGTLRLSLAAVVMAVPLLLMPQMPSTDMWGYVMYGRVPVLHGGNPITDPPSNYPHDPFLRRMYWKSLPSIYGPAWVIVCNLLTRAAQFLGGAPWAYMLSFKGFVFACHLVNVVLVRKILRVIRPGRETLGTLLYAWNPLVLFECAGSAHNDVFMLTLLLAGIAAAAAGRSATAAGWMMAAGLAKLPGVLALPAYSLYVARQSPKPLLTLARHGAIALAVAVVLYTPYWRGAATFRATADAPNLKIMNHSPDAGVAKAVERLLSGGARPREWWEGTPAPGSLAARVRSAVRHASLACFFLCLAALSLRRVRDLDDWLDRMTWIFVAYLLLAAFQFNAWYATWLVPLAAVARRPSPLLLLSSVVFLVYYLPIEAAGRAALFFAPLLLLVLLQIPRLWRPASALGEGVRGGPAGPDWPGSARDETPRFPWPLRGKWRTSGAERQDEWPAPAGFDGVGTG